MKVKDLKKFLDLYADDKEIILIMPSGNTYEIREELIAQKTLTDKKREVCKIYIK